MNSQEKVAGILVLAGRAPTARAAGRLAALAVQRPRPLILAADGGAAHLSRLSIRPDRIIGDMDSMPKGLFPEVERVLFPTAKDYSDGEEALKILARECDGPLAMFGALGGRTDHLLINLFMPLHALADPSRLTIYDDDCDCYYSIGHCEISGQPGDILSLIPLTPVEGIYLLNLAYPLHGYDACPGDTRLLSNVFLREKAAIRHKGGTLLIIHTKKQEQI